MKGILICVIGLVWTLVVQGPIQSQSLLELQQIDTLKQKMAGKKVEHISVANYLKSKYFGTEVEYFYPQTYEKRKGIVVAIIMEKEGFSVKVQTPKEDIQECLVVFQKSNANALRRRTQGQSIQAIRNRELEHRLTVEKYLSSATQSLLGDGALPTSLSSVDQMQNLKKEITEEALKGEPFLVYDQSLKNKKIADVIVVNNGIIVTDGTELEIKFISQNEKK